MLLIQICERMMNIRNNIMMKVLFEKEKKLIKQKNYGMENVSHDFFIPTFHEK